MKTKQPNIIAATTWPQIEYASDESTRIPVKQIICVESLSVENNECACDQETECVAD